MGGGLVLLLLLLWWVGGGEEDGDWMGGLRSVAMVGDERSGGCGSG